MHLSRIRILLFTVSSLTCIMGGTVHADTNQSEEGLFRAFQQAQRTYWSAERREQTEETRNEIEEAQAELERQQEKIAQLQADILYLQEKERDAEEEPEYIEGFQPDSDHDRTMVLVPSSAVSGFIPREYQYKKEIVLSTLLFGLAGSLVPYFNSPDAERQKIIIGASAGLLVGACINAFVLNCISRKESKKVADFFLNRIESLQTTPIKQIDEDGDTIESHGPCGVKTIKRRVKILPQQIYNCLMVAAEKYKTGEWTIGELKNYAFEFRKSGAFRQ